MEELSLSQANGILESALEVARKQGLPPVAVVVLDPSGHVRALQRENGASMFRVDIATGKAWAAIAMGAASSVLGDRARQNPIFFGSLAASSGGRFIPHAGAVLIRDSAGSVIGAVGASGGTGDEDEMICATAIEAVGLRHD